jgi:hypothetical protein
MDSMTKDLSREFSDEFARAMELVAHGVRRGNLAEARKWLAVAERCLRLHSQLVHIIAAVDKFDTARIEQPYRLSVLEYRARRPGWTHAARSSPRSEEDER